MRMQCFVNRKVRYGWLYKYQCVQCVRVMCMWRRYWPTSDVTGHMTSVDTRHSMETRRSESYLRLIGFLVLSAACITVITSNPICTNKSYSCKTTMTCCKADNGSKVKGPFGCCPIAKAVCCLDGLHCCPNNTTCYAPHGTKPVTRCYHKSSEPLLRAARGVFLVDAQHDPVSLISRPAFSRKSKLCFVVLDSHVAEDPERKSGNVS